MNYKDMIRAELNQNKENKVQKKVKNKRFICNSSSFWDEAVDAQETYQEQEENFFSSVDDGDEDMECVFFS